jgi:hypothetical protein
MKDKEKQIEEMAKECCKDFYKCKPRYDLNCIIRQALEKALNQGYRKIPEDSVVLSREEFENNLTLSIGYEIGSKETAEKIFTEVLDLEQLKVIRDMGWETIYNSLCNEILELAKQFGVEIKEGEQ